MISAIGAAENLIIETDMLYPQVNYDRAIRIPATDLKTRHLMPNLPPVSRTGFFVWPRSFREEVVQLLFEP